MPNTKSACKRVLIAERNRLRNKAYKSAVKTVIKKTLKAIHSLEVTHIDLVYSLVSLSYSKIDRAVQRGILHPNAGNSKKALLSKQLKQAQGALQT